MGAWKATLVDKGTSASAHIEDGALTSLQGTVGTRLDRAGAPFAQVAASGGWTPDTGVSGTGAAEMLVEELHITDMGRFGLYMVKGVKAEAEVASNEVKRVGGEVPLELRDGGRKFLRGDLAGDYVLAEEQFTGSGKATVQEDHQLGAVRDLNVFVVKGSSAEVGITQNNVDRIGGDMKVSVRDQSEFLVAGIKDGSWDFKGGTVLTGTGSAEVTRDKELVRTDKYAFALRGGKRGAGAGVVVEQDEIKEVNGNVPFLVSDAAGPLIDGSVSGTWKAATGMLNGNGEVALARDLDFSGGRLRMLKGSGGTAVVVDSALQRFEGQIFASILDAQGLELAKVNANGTFDAVTGEIVHAHGGITVTRVIDVFEGMRVTKMDGQGDIEHNELVKVEGSIDVAFGKDGSNLAGKVTLGGMASGGRTRPLPR